MPLFGYFYRRTNLLVDRSSMRSRKTVFDRAGVKIDEGYGLCIYPEGGVPDPSVDLAAFKNGAFRLAVEKGVTIIPVSYPDNKRHLPFDFAKGGPGVLRAIVHPFITPIQENPDEVNRMMQECRRAIASGLELSDTALGHNTVKA